uniref:Ig-like domain-containing protein n=1 Tax=Sinocyclocheilus grahami TaxID=75366 RepID=A0A672S4P3_SINGR
MLICLHGFITNSFTLVVITFMSLLGPLNQEKLMYTFKHVVGPADSVFAVAGEDVILPCSVKPNISVVDMRVEWFRPGLKDSLVHLYEDHEDRNTDQIQSYRGRTKLIHQELQRGDASLRLSSVRVSDEGRYKCFIQSKSWHDAFDVYVKLQRNTDRFSVKHTITVYERDSKIHCRVKLRHHMLETLIITSNRVKQGEAESRQSKTRPLNERDTWLESSGAFIMPQSTASAPSGRAYVGKKIILDTFESSVIMLLCAVVTGLLKRTTY